MARFKNLRTGNILNTNSAVVIAQMSSHPENYAPVAEKAEKAKAEKAKAGK